VTKTEKSWLGLEDTVDLAGVLSFPASDPPGWTPTHVGAPRSTLGWALGPDLLHEVVQRIHDDLHFFADAIADAVDPRDVAAAIEHRFVDAGVPAKERPREGRAASNVEAVIAGKRSPSRSVVVGVRYDRSLAQSPSGGCVGSLAILFALAHALREAPLDRTVRLVAFVDRPLRSGHVLERGSGRYLDALLREGPSVSSMVNLDLGGRRFTRPDSLYLVGRSSFRSAMSVAKRGFDRAGLGVILRVAMIPFFLPKLRASDERPFVRKGIPAFTISGGVPLRTKRHFASGRGLEPDFDRLGRMSIALTALVRALANAPDVVIR
jgi:hypothetical protein